MTALFSLTSLQQKNPSPPQEIQAKVISASNSLPLESVHVINLNTIVGTISDEGGTFTIPAKVGDTLYLTYLGFKSEKIRVSNDLIRLKNSSIALTELAYALEEVIVRPYQLTGYLEIDIKYLPISTAFQYSITTLTIFQHAARVPLPLTQSKDTAQPFSTFFRHRSQASPPVCWFP